MVYTYQGEYSFASGFVSLACFEVSSAESLHSGGEGRGGGRGGKGEREVSSVTAVDYHLHWLSWTDGSNIYTYNRWRVSFETDDVVRESVAG